MNKELIEEAVKRTRAAVEDAKTRGEKLLLFSTLYSGWSDIQLTFDEKEELKKRLGAEGFTLQNEYVEGDTDWRLEQKVVLRF